MQESSPAVCSATERFASCRWRARPSNRAFCTHIDVQPCAGTNGFNASAWCSDCTFYKMRRVANPRQSGSPFGRSRSVVSRFTKWAPLGMGLGWSEAPAPQQAADDQRHS